MADIKENKDLEKEQNGTNETPEQQENGGAEQPPANQDANGDKKENFFVRIGKAVVTFGKEKVVPAAEKAAPWVGGAIVGAGLVAGACIKAGWDSANKTNGDDSDDYNGDNYIDTEATEVDPETSNDD